MVDDQPTLGGKVGGRVASLVSAATVATRAKMAPHTVGVAMQVQDSFFRLVGAEIRNTIGEPLARIADSEKAPEWARKTFNFLARGHGQWQGFLAQSVGGQALGVGLSQLLTNELTPVISEILATNPNALVDPSVMAGLVARGQLSVSQGRSEAAFQGVDGTRFGWLVGSATHGADPGSLIEAYRREQISEPELNAGLKDAGYSAEAISVISRLWTVPLAPAALADMVQRGIMTQAQAETVASHSGVVKADFDRMVAAAGGPPGVQDLLFLYRRGQIDRARLERGIRQSAVRNEWIDAVEQLGIVPMSTSDAIAAAVQNHLPLGEAKKIATENGLDPAHFQPLYDTAGAPLSPSEMLQLWRRSVVTQSEVEQSLREGRLKDKYIPHFLALKAYVFPPDTTRLLYERGAIDKATAIRKLAEYGIEGSDAEAYLIAAEHAKMTTSRDLSESMIRTLYADRAISHDVAKTNLTNLGYDDTEAEQVLSVVTLQRNQSVLNTAISRVHARYVAHRVNETDATTALDALHVPVDQRNALLDTWGVERDLNTPVLTVSQTQQAAKKGIITPADAYGRLINLGYSPQDADILLLLAGITPGG